MDNQYDDDGDCIILSEVEKAQLLSDIEDIDQRLRDSHDSGLWRALKHERRQLVAEVAAGRRLPVLDEETFYDHEIIETMAGGWQLRLLEDGKQVGEAIFNVPQSTPSLAHAWWDTLALPERQHWIVQAQSSSPGEAHQAFLKKEAWHDAVQAAGEWLSTRPAE